MTILKYQYLILIIISILGFFSKNNILVIASISLLAINIIPFFNFLDPVLNKYGLTLGILILTIAVLLPLANGRIDISDILHSFAGYKSVAAILVGILVAWLGGRGVVLMKADPQIIVGLLIGTIIGIGFFKGIPVGPLIAAGILSLLIGK